MDRVTRIALEELDATAKAIADGTARPSHIHSVRQAAAHLAMVCSVEELGLLLPTFRKMVERISDLPHEMKQVREAYLDLTRPLPTAKDLAEADQLLDNAEKIVETYFELLEMARAGKPGGPAALKQLMGGIISTMPADELVVFGDKLLAILEQNVLDVKKTRNAFAAKVGGTNN